MYAVCFYVGMSLHLCVKYIVQVHCIFVWIIYVECASLYMMHTLPYTKTILDIISALNSKIILFSFIPSSCLLLYIFQMGFLWRVVWWKNPPVERVLLQIKHLEKLLLLIRLAIECEFVVFVILLFFYVKDICKCVKTKKKTCFIIIIMFELWFFLLFCIVSMAPN